MVKTRTVIVSGDKAQRAATALVGRSAWFAVTPLPDGEFEFSVKPGEGLEGVIKNAAEQGDVLIGALRGLSDEFDRYSEEMTKIGYGHGDYGLHRDAAKAILAKAEKGVALSLAASR